MSHLGSHSSWLSRFKLGLGTNLLIVSSDVLDLYVLARLTCHILPPYLWRYREMSVIWSWESGFSKVFMGFRTSSSKYNWGTISSADFATFGHLHFLLFLVFKDLNQSRAAWRSANGCGCGITIQKKSAPGRPGSITNK